MVDGFKMPFLGVYMGYLKKQVSAGCIPQQSDYLYIYWLLDHLSVVFNLRGRQELIMLVICVVIFEAGVQDSTQARWHSDKQIT